MKRKIVLSFFFLCVILYSMMITLSCKQRIDKATIKPRISFLSDNNSTTEVIVYLENAKTGNIITGAFVYVTDSSNSVTILDFDNDMQCYKTSIINSLSNETFFVTIKSAISDEICIKVSHKKLGIKPTINIIEDNSGNSVFEGKELKSDLPIQIAWDSIGEDIVYKVIIQNGLNTVFVKSTENSNIIVPAGIFAPSNSYYVTVTAYYINGDPLFKRTSYYSSSIIKSGGITINVE